MSTTAQRPAVLAVVVATDGAATLPRTLDSLAAQDYPHLNVVAVDNGSSDTSRAVLLEHLDPRRVLVAERDLGFGGAVGMALDAEIARGNELVLLVHDDLELRSDAVSRLVAAMEADDELAVVGCKLVEWEDQRQLQAVGMSVDVTGRADPGVDPDEIDQGQRDHESRTLYVSTAGMLVRRDRFEQLGRFDHRYHLFRDDLDLCWRAWLRGWSVEVVPEAVASHEASASTYQRLGQTATLGPRYFAERNTLATLLKNYGPGRLLLVLPLFLLVGVAKVLGFVATRRLGDAWQTLRAWVWNVMHLAETRRLRRRVQESRVRGDRELKPLFAQVTARLRAYAEAFGELLSGGTDEMGLRGEDGPPVPDPTLGERISRTIRTSPVGVAAVLLALLGAVVSIPLVGRTPLVGGELAAWPEGALTLARGYLRPWTVGDLPAVVDVTPGQALLSLASVVTGGSTWAAPRLLLLAVVPVAWASALRAGRLVTHRRLPRVAGATLYALSPPMLAALRTGRVGAAVAAALLPLLAIAGARAVLPGVPADRAWRATAAASLTAAAVVAFEPATAALVVVAAVVAAAGVGFGSSGDVPVRLSRLGVGMVGAGVLLAPWLPALRGEWLTDGSAQAVPLARVLLLTPTLPGFPGVLVGLGLAIAALLGVAFATDHVGEALGLAAVYLMAVGLAWVSLRGSGPAGVWPGAPLIVAALAAAGLLAMAFASAEETLGEHTFGWRQLAALSAGVLVVVGVAAAGLSIAGDAWEGYGEQPNRLPAFLASEVDVEAIGPFRVLVISETDGRVVWSITDADGPSQASWGHVMADDVADTLEDRVDQLVLGQDPGAAAALGYLGIRYVVVPSDGLGGRLDGALSSQLDLVGQPVAAGRVLRVTTWLPRWSMLPVAATESVAAGVPLPAGVRPTPLAAATRGEGGLLALADPVGEQVVWSVTVDGAPVSPEVLGGVTTWEVGPGELEVRRVGERTRLALVTVQALLVGLAISLSLRAPGFARESRS